MLYMKIISSFSYVTIFETDAFFVKILYTQCIRMYIFRSFRCLSTVDSYRIGGGIKLITNRGVFVRGQRTSNDGNKRLMRSVFQDIS